MISENFEPIVIGTLLRPGTGALRLQHRRTHLGKIFEGLSRGGLVKVMLQRYCENFFL
jgi:hypothetical protein